jgi:YHS domain-containing protein
MKLLTTGLVLMIVSILHAQNAPLRSTDYNIEKNGLAIQGYDPVSYFVQNKAVKGTKQFAVSYDGLLYYFASNEDKEAFKQSPGKYEPQYGGWCAYAMGNTGEKVEVDPETFKIKDGKLYLFYNKYFTNTLKSWNKDENSLQTKADQNWKKVYPH